MLANNDVPSYNCYINSNYHHHHSTIPQCYQHNKQSDSSAFIKNNNVPPAQALSSENTLSFFGLCLLNANNIYNEEVKQRNLHSSSNGGSGSVDYDEDDDDVSYGCEDEANVKYNHQHHSFHSHNESERSRRSHLRTCMDNLRNEVGSATGSRRLTTLYILQRAKEQIKVLNSKNIMITSLLAKENKENEEWQARNDVLREKRRKLLLRKAKKMEATNNSRQINASGLATAIKECEEAKTRFDSGYESPE